MKDENKTKKQLIHELTVLRREIEGLKQAETGHKHSDAEQRKLISIIENSSDFIGIATRSGVVLYVNKAGIGLVGLGSLEEARSKVIFDFVSDEAKKQLETYLSCRIHCVSH